MSSVTATPKHMHVWIGGGEKDLVHLPEAERRIVEYVAEGLGVGIGKFGPLYAGKRNWPKEGAEELRDALIYLLAAIMDYAKMLPAPAKKTTRTGKALRKGV